MAAFDVCLAWAYVAVKPAGGYAFGRQMDGWQGAGRRDMVKEHEVAVASFLAKAMAVMCVRNTILEDFHGGIHPVTHTGDFSDVVVIDANGRRIPWTEVAHIEQDEMRELMRQIVNRLYTVNLKSGDMEFLGMLERAAMEAGKWDEPELDEVTMQGLEQRRKRNKQPDETAS